VSGRSYCFGVPVERHSYGRVFTAGVGTVEAPINDGWRAEDQNYLWFSPQSRQVSKGDHMFTLAAGPAEPSRGALRGHIWWASSAEELLPNGIPRGDGRTR